MVMVAGVTPPYSPWPSVSFQQVVEWQPTSFSEDGVTSAGLATNYYASTGFYGKVFTVANVGSCIQDLHNLPPCTNIPPTWHPPDDIFEQDEPTHYNKQHLTDPHWVRYPHPNDMWELTPTNTLFDQTHVDGVRYRVRMPMVELQETCVEDGTHAVSTTISDLQFMYRYNMTLNWFRPQGRTCERREMGVAVSRRLHATVGFQTSALDVHILAATHIPCHLAECRDRYHGEHYRKYFHTCNGMSPSYRLRLSLRVQFKASVPPTPFVGFVHADDIVSNNNGCFGFPSQVTWESTVSEDEGNAIILHLETECLNIDKGWKRDCGRFHTCDVDENGELDEDEHQVYDYSVALKPRRCHDSRCVSGNRTFGWIDGVFRASDPPSGARCDNECAYLIEGDHQYPLQITLKVDKCPDMEEPDLVKLQCPEPTETAAECHSGWVVTTIILAVLLLAACIWLVWSRCKRHKKGTCRAKYHTRKRCEAKGMAWRHGHCVLLVDGQEKQCAENADCPKNKHSRGLCLLDKKKKNIKKKKKKNHS